MLNQKSLLIVLFLLSFLSIQSVWAAKTAKGKAASAMQLYSSKNFLKAAYAFTKEISTEPGKSKAENYFYLGHCYYQLGKPRRAAQMYRMVLEKFPSSKQARPAQAMLAKVQPQQSASIRTRQTTRSTSSSSRAPRTYSSRTRSTSSSDLARLPRENRFYFSPGRTGHMVTDIYLNGRKMKAYFDTGANAHFGINHLRAAGIYDMPRGKPNGYASGWAGKKIPAWHTKGKLRIGNMERTVPVSIEQNMKLMPLVGQGFLQGYDYEIQNSGPKKYVTMTKKNSGSGSYASRSRGSQVSSLYDVPCVSIGPREYIKMKINGREIQVLLDTGADATILSMGAAQKLGISIPANARVVRGTGVGGVVSYKIVYCDVQLGPIYAKGFPIQVGGGGGTCAVGQNLLSKHRYKIDKKMKLLRFFH